MHTPPSSKKKTTYIPLLSIGLVPQRQWLSAALGKDIRLGLFPSNDRHWLGWGDKRSARRAKALANNSTSSTAQLEDGFIRSIGLPSGKYPVWSIIYDQIGIYYNAYQASALEQLIQNIELDNTLYQRAQKCIELICQHNITKYNHAPDLQLNIEADKKHILIVDQTRGDLSISASGASEHTFQRMLDVAMSANPNSIIWIKTHPEVSAQQKQGHYTPSPDHPQIRYITTAANPLSIIKQMDEVYVVSSQMGFEALLLGKKVHCFGLPWYAGWGLTDDQHAPIHILQGRRPIGQIIERLFAAAYFFYTYYIDPYTGKRCELENILDIAVIQKQWNTKLAGHVHCVGFSPWKKQFIRNYLHLPSAKLSFGNEPPKETKDIDHLIIWGMKQPQITATMISPTKLWRMEDGFVRSVGLGAKLIPPYSLVLDDEGIYYNPQQPSRLEHILSSLVLNEAQRTRARLVIETLVQQNISKYNLHGQNDWPTNIPTNKRIILVPGQVSDDASIRYGTSNICNSNEQLLKIVRQNHPDAYIVYKPHPDVLSGLREGQIPINNLQESADAVVTQANMSVCLGLCDEVHTMTSLTGFEALLRNKKVYCYGQPFYSGWGLTIDLEPHPRRVRQLDLETLVYGTLIEYPCYALSKQSLGAKIEQVTAQIAHELTLPRKERSFFTHLLPFIKRFRK